ncbi:MAG: JAB domain-containing protein [Sphingomonadaceae bacterium]
MIGSSGTLGGDGLRENRAFLGYLSETLAPLETERLHAVFLRQDGSFISAEEIADGSSELVRADLRKLFSKALEVNAEGMILAHNHPSGDARPSEVDIENTNRIVMLSAALRIALIDHLIVASLDVYSIRRGDFL